MSEQVQALVNAAKSRKAEMSFDDSVKVYGDEAQALKALDCTSRKEAVNMLWAVQTVRIVKVDGVVRVF